MKKWTVIAAFLALSACTEERLGRAQPAVGDPVPDYSAQSFGGDSVDLADLRSRPLMVNLWATWCAPCRAEIPELQELAEYYGESLEVIGISIDGRGSEDRIQGFLEDAGVDFRILLDPDQRFVREFATIGVPETFLIDTEGIIRARWTGRFFPFDAANLALIEDVF